MTRSPNDVRPAARRVGWLTAIVAQVALAAGCSTNTATGRYQFNTLDRDEEIQVGEEAKPELVKEYGGVFPSTQLSGYVTEVGMKMVAQVEDPEKQSLPWEFTVLDSEIINAFALPGGKVFISIGLLREFSNEASLAGVLGHEVGHVTAEHAEQRMGQATTVQVLGNVVGAAASVFGVDPGLSQATSVLVGASGEGFLLKFSRDQESEADSLGIRYMIQAGYDPEGLVQVMTILKNASAAGETPEILSTHPYPETRLERIEKLLQTKFPGERGNPRLRMGVDEWKTRAVPYLPRTTPPPPASTMAAPPSTHA